MVGCQNWGPFLRTEYIRCRIIVGTQKGTIILTIAHMYKQLMLLEMNRRQSLKEGEILLILKILHDLSIL